jgi:hypothetical protein
MDENFSELAKLVAWNHHQKKDEFPYNSNKSSTGNDSEILGTTKAAAHNKLRP